MINAPYTIHVNKPGAVDQIVNAIIELGQIKKRGDKLFLDGDVVGPRDLLGYLSARITFLKNEKPILPPWNIILAVLARAHRGQVPVRDVDEGAS